jgi:signal transduction histidine kinase
MIHEKVLVVDFDAATNRIVKDILSKQGYTILSADNNQTFLNNIQKKLIDILIINLSLEGMDSIEMIQRARFVRPGIGIIVLSLNEPRDVIIRAFQEGAQAILEKPFDSQDLVRVVNEVLEKSRLVKENIRLKTLLPLFKLSESLVAELSEEHIFDHIVRLVYMETRANKVSLLLLDEVTQQLIIRAGLGLPKDSIGECIDMSDDSISWSVIKTGKAIVFDGEARRTASAGRSGIISSLCVPLSLKGKTIGVINCSKVATRVGFTESDLELLSILAGQATIAIENARLFDNIRRQQNKLESSLKKAVTAQEDERGRISSELHDGLAQWLVSASYCMQLVEAQIGMLKYDEARNELGRATEIINQSVKELRRIILDLHPIALAELGLISALQQNIDMFNKENGVHCDFKVIGYSKDTTFIHDITIYRVILEALNNIRKHAHASRANVGLQFDSDIVSVEIHDNGVGFDLNEAVKKKVLRGSLGLVNMKERAEVIGGNLDIITAPGKGTKIVMKIPVSVS